MNLLDLIPWVPGPEPARGRNRSETVSGAVVVFGLPMLDLVLLMVTDLSKRPEMALLWLPVMFTLAGAAVCVLARLDVSRSFVALLGCAWWCLLAGFALVVIDILIFPF